MVNSKRPRRSKVSPDSKSLGLWVKARRIKLGLTLEELAASVRCSKGYIHKVENAALHSSAQRPPAPTVEFLDKLARALGTSIAAPLAKLGYLKQSEVGMETPATHPVRILHYYNELSHEDQEIAEAMVKALWTKQQRANKQAELTKPKPHKKKTA